MANSNTPYAFPHLVPHNPDFAYSATGMTLRDYFAGQALAGLMSATDADGEWTAVNGAEPNAARYAYRAADAMLAARSTTKED
jgi:hypothetical protein